MEDSPQREGSPKPDGEKSPMSAGVLGQIIKMKSVAKKALIATAKLRIRTTNYNEPTSRVEGHNFAIKLLQTLEARMEEVKEGFCLYGEERPDKAVSKEEFVSIITKAVRKGPRNILEDPWIKLTDIDLKISLGGVFNAVDNLETGLITFEEFLGYIIDCTLHGQIGRVEEHVPHYTNAGCAFLKNLDEVTKAKYCPELKKIITGGKTIGLVDGATMTTRSYPYVANAKNYEPAVYDIDYVPDLHAAIVVGTEITPQLVDLHRGNVLFKIPSSESLSTCAFDRSSNTALVSGQRGIVRTYRITQQRTSEKKYEIGPVIKNHTQMVTRILPLEREGLVATSSLDSTVYIQDVSSGETLTRFLGHSTGVISVAYIRHMNFCASCCYDIEPKVWMISSVRQRSDCFTLSDPDFPHVDHVVDICSIPDTPQIVTMDCKGIMKIWDIRMFRCAQTIRAEKFMTGIVDTSTVKWHTMCWDPDNQELNVFSLRRVQKFHQKIPIKEQQEVSTAVAGSAAVLSAISATVRSSDEYPVICLAHNSANQTVMTASECRIKVWDLFTGKHEILLDKLTVNTSAMSALAVSDNGKTFILGHRHGQICSHVYSTGVKVFCFVQDGRGPEVLQLMYMPNAQSFAAITWEGCALYEDRIKTDDAVVSYFPDPLRAHDVKCITYDTVFGIFGIGERTGNVILWDGRRNRFSPDSVRPVGHFDCGRVEIGCILFLTGYPVVAVADNQGSLFLYTTSPHPMPNEKFAQMMLKNREILHLQFYPPKKVLFCADETGVVFGLDLSVAFASINVVDGYARMEELLNSIGRTGKRSDTVTTLEPFEAVQAHSDTISGMMLAPATGILLTTSVDRRVMAWNLSLTLRGEFDPVAPNGRYVCSYVKPKGGVAVNLLAPDDDLNLLPFSDAEAEGQPEVASPKERSSPLYKIREHVKQQQKERVKREREVAEVEEKKKEEQHEQHLIQVQSFRASKEELERSAAQLESVKLQRKQSVSHLKTQELLDADSHNFSVKSPSASRAKKFLPAPFRTRPKEYKEGYEEVNKEYLDEPDEIDVYSPNSSGVVCHSLLTHAPRPGVWKPKSVVVKSESGGNGGEAFTVTMDFPVPPNAKTERDFLIRQLMEKEELHKNDVPVESPMEALKLIQHDINPSESKKKKGTLRGRPPTREVKTKKSNVAQRALNRSMFSTTQATSAMSINSYYDKTHQSFASTALSAALKTLLPVDLINIRKAVKSRKAWDCTICEGTPLPELKMKSDAMPGQYERFLPPRMQTAEGREGMEGLEGSVSPLPVLEHSSPEAKYEAIDWQATNARANTSFQTTLPTMHRDLTGEEQRKSNNRATTSLGFMTFGIKSIQLRDDLQDGHKAWTKSFRVDNDDGV